jgi:carbonic anhydrase
MRLLKHLFERNSEWSKRVRASDPGFFAGLTAQQTPKYLWIGCADSRVPANEIVDLQPGELFVHRNVANVVVHSDLNCLSVLQYAVDVLKVEHVIVCGHYGCGGVQAAMQDARFGLVDNWLRHIQDVMKKHGASQADRLCELNVIEQALNVCQTTIVQDAWARGAKLAVHGWVYALSDGLLRDLGFCAASPGEVQAAYDSSLKRSSTS